jgi:phosphate transport system permease protein
MTTATTTSPDAATPAAGVPSPRPPRRPQRIRPQALGRPLAALALAAASVAVVFALTPLSGLAGWVMASYAAFLGLLAADTRRRDGQVAARDQVATVMVATAALITVIPLVLIVGYVLSQGLKGLSGAFFSQTFESVGPLDPPTVGGARHAIVGTIQQVGLATLLATPLGLLTAVHLTESQGRLSRVVRLLVDAMSGIPSIVAGLFIYTMWVVRFRQGFSGLAAAMALAVLMLPTVARAAEEMLRLVPVSLREASLALGAPQWRTVLRVVLPAARNGIVTAAVLGVARIAGETAPLLMTAFGSDSLNSNPFNGPQSALPLFAFYRVRNALPSQIARGWAAALVLIVIVLALFTVARAFGARARKGP